MTQPEFLPATRDEMRALGWDELDVLLVTGDAYVDSHSFGASLLGRWLVEHGFKTGIVAQPGWENTDDVSRMGRPRLFAGVTAGALDSLVAHYTAFRKKRSDDAYSPGGKTGLRPNRAAIVYTGLVRQAFPGLPVVAGGIEASLRRASQFDFWSDSLRRSLVLDSKVDAILYGMGEKSILALAELFRDNPTRIRPGDAIAKARLAGSAYAVHPDLIPQGAVELPSHEAILADPALLIKATLLFEEQMLRGGPCLAQRSGGRAVIFEPPPPPLTTGEMDRIYGLPFTRRAHPSYSEPIPAVAMIADSVVSHRGCAGGCSFCSLALHQGRTIQSRSEQSILEEIARMAARPEWRGSISDIGGPSANMWGARCEGERENCKRSSCLFPKKCRFFKYDAEAQVELLHRAQAVEGVNHVRVASGVRHDLALESDAYMKALVGEFTGGQLKIAPEHIVEKVLRMMRKPPQKTWETFIKSFEKLSAEAEKEQYLVPYLMSSFPGCTDDDMAELGAWLRRRGWRPQQVQCFIPTPGTVATAMFFAEQDVDGRPIMVARTDSHRTRQHRILFPEAAPDSRERGSKPPRRDKRPGSFGYQPERGSERRTGRPRPTGFRPDRGNERSDERSGGGGFRPNRRPDGQSERPRPSGFRSDRGNERTDERAGPGGFRPNRRPDNQTGRPRPSGFRSDRGNERSDDRSGPGGFRQNRRPDGPSGRPRPSGFRPDRGNERSGERSGGGGFRQDRRPERGTERPDRPSRPYNSESGRFKPRTPRPPRPPGRGGKPPHGGGGGRGRDRGGRNP